MSSFGQRYGSLQTSGPCPYNCDLFRFPCFDDLYLVFPAGNGIDQTIGRQTVKDIIETSLVAGYTGVYFVQFAFPCLFREQGVEEGDL